MVTREHPQTSGKGFNLTFRMVTVPAVPRRDCPLITIDETFNKAAHVLLLSTPNAAARQRVLFDVVLPGLASKLPWSPFLARLMWNSGAWQAGFRHIASLVP